MKCKCHAYCESECVCGAWEINKAQKTEMTAYAGGMLKVLGVIGDLVLSVILFPFIIGGFLVIDYIWDKVIQPYEDLE